MVTLGEKKYPTTKFFIFVQMGKTQPLQKFIFPFWSNSHTIQNTIHQHPSNFNIAIGKCDRIITSTIMKI
jgi:hypothetical protein